MNIPYKSLRRRPTALKGRYCAFCGQWFIPDHNRTRYCGQTCLLKARRLKERSARVLKIKNLERAERDAIYAKRRENHRLRMETVRVVRGITLQPGFDLCQRTGCDEVYLVDDSRRIYCSDRCRNIAGNSRRFWRRDANAKAVEDRKPIARRAVGLIHTPSLEDAPVSRGLPADEGVDGQIPWNHSWSGADPLPA